MKLPKKEYLGDAVYASFDGYHIWLTTEYGLSVTNRIALEPSVLAALNRYFQNVCATEAVLDDYQDNYEENGGEG